MKRYSSLALSIATLLLVSAFCEGQLSSRMEIDRKGETIVLEPYAPNIVRVTLSLQHDNALAKPGYGFVGAPSSEGWSQGQTELNDVYQSSRILATVERDHPPLHPKLCTELDIAKFFNGSTPGAHITFSTPGGKKLLEMTGWQQAVPNHKDGTADINNDRRPTDPEFFTVGATFVSPDDEHYYGLGDNHEGFLDHRGHPVRCWNDYFRPPRPPPASLSYHQQRLRPHLGQSIEDHDRTRLQRADQVDLAGGRPCLIFCDRRQHRRRNLRRLQLLTGPTPLLPKAAYGYIQCKQRYSSQEEVLSVAKGYRDRHLPADVMVVDWFYYTKMGQMDMDPKFWPDPAAMNKQLHDMGFETMISVWPRFVPDDRYYAMLEKNGWLIHTADGKPINGLPYDRAGSDIDTTNPDAAKWYWNTIRDNILSKGFDSLWADETEPDLPPNGSYYKIGPGTQFYNVYPLFHTAALYDGFRRDEPKSARSSSPAMPILAFSAMAPSSGRPTFIPPGTLYRRQIPTGLDFAASGMTYWSNDTGGWQYLPAGASSRASAIA